MAKKILFIVTSHGELGSSGNASGSWLEELATPYWQFVDAGFDVAIASPKRCSRAAMSSLASATA